MNDEHVPLEYTTLCNYNPPPAFEESTFMIFRKLQRPTSFCDKHIDASLVLLHVKTSPTLIQHITTGADVAVDSLKEMGLRLPSIEHSILFPSPEFMDRNVLELSPIIDATGVADKYVETMGACASRIASTLVLHPHATTWYPTIYFNSFVAKHQSLTLRDDDYPALSVCDNKLELSDELQTELDDATFRLLGRIARRWPKLAVWQMLTPDAEPALRDMDKWIDPMAQDFVHDRCHTSGWNSSTGVAARPADATTTPWNSPMEHAVRSFVPDTSQLHDKAKFTGLTNMGNPIRRSERLRSLNSGKSRGKPATQRRHGPTTKQAMWSAVSLPLPSRRKAAVKSSTGYGDGTTELLVQHAWSLAVERDSTFIVFNCGNYERIGFRHRQSQTLFLSNLIDVSNCKDPAYGKIHIGLHTCIARDAVNRVTEARDDESGGFKGKKRKREPSPSAPKRRPRTRHYDAAEQAEKKKQHETYKIASSEIASRQLLLLRMNYGKFNSIAPAGMLRIGPSLYHNHAQDWKKTSRLASYKPHQYFLLSITSEIASGAVGFAYRGTTETLTMKGDTVIHPVVVKLAFEEKQQERMRHEFSIYEHLASANVKGVPVVHGLFEDVESGVVGLVMEDVGHPILYRRDPERPAFYPTTDAERAGFIQALRDIHDAGVRHRDLRAENLTVDRDGNPYIIDFDQAKISRKRKARRKEMQLFEDFFDGVHPEYEWTGNERSTDADPGDEDTDSDGFSLRSSELNIAFKARKDGRSR